jgi:hypothetical protein
MCSLQLSHAETTGALITVMMFAMQMTNELERIGGIAKQ